MHGIGTKRTTGQSSPKTTPRDSTKTQALGKITRGTEVKSKFSTKK